MSIRAKPILRMSYRLSVNARRVSCFILTQTRPKSQRLIL